MRNFLFPRYSIAYSDNNLSCCDKDADESSNQNIPSLPNFYFPAYPRVMARCIRRTQYLKFQFCFCKSLFGFYFQYIIITRLKGNDIIVGMKGKAGFILQHNGIAGTVFQHHS